MLCNEGQFHGARGCCGSAVFPVPRATLTQWFVCNTLTSLNKLIQMEKNTRVSQLIVQALCQHSQAWRCQHI